MLLPAAIPILPPSRVTKPPFMALTAEIPVWPSPRPRMAGFFVVIRLLVPCDSSPIRPPGGRIVMGLSVDVIEPPLIASIAGCAVLVK